jgi:hypothetical protein
MWILPELLTDFRTFSNSFWVISKGKGVVPYLLPHKTLNLSGNKTHKFLLKQSINRLKKRNKPKKSKPPMSRWPLSPLDACTQTNTDR